jgi:hypothetical protein
LKLISEKQLEGRRLEIDPIRPVRLSFPRGRLPSREHFPGTLASEQKRLENPPKFNPSLAALQVDFKDVVNCT